MKYFALCILFMTYTGNAFSQADSSAKKSNSTLMDLKKTSLKARLMELKTQHSRDNVIFEFDRTTLKEYNNFQLELIKTETASKRDTIITNRLLKSQNLELLSITIDPTEAIRPSIVPNPQGIISDPQESDIQNLQTKEIFISGPSQFDSRIELRKLNPSINWQYEILKNSTSVGIVVEKNKIHAITDSIFQIDIGTTLGQHFKLCPGEPFSSQPIVGIGTAFIINDRTMLTASHVFSSNPEKYAIIFGFEMVNKAGAFEGFVSSQDIYYPSSIIKNIEDLDLMFFQVSRRMSRAPLKFSVSTKFIPNTPVYMIGHPSGLPKKVALNASIQTDNDTRFFYTTLDSFQGNSGSPVFNFNTNEVIGILVSGEIDYKWSGNCNYSDICKIPYCRGEKVIKISTISEFLN